MYFPQHDFAGKMNAFNKTEIIVDKPHNWYIQMAVNTGVLSMISMILFLLLVLLYSFKSIMKTRKNNDMCLISIGFICSIIGYCIAALFNDSVVSVAPVFWVFVGLSIANTHMLNNADTISTSCSIMNTDEPII